MKRGGTCLLLAILCLLAGAGLRLAGLARELSDFVLPAQAAAGLTRVFYQFHPDEETLVRAGLRLDDPLSPPLTAYGTAPMYLVRGALELAGLVWGDGSVDLGDHRDRPWLFLTARLLSALLSCLSLWLLFVLGRRFWDPAVACLAVCFAAAAPLAVQQAHFYTIDGVFTFLSLAAFYALLRAAESGQRRHYVLAGLLIGLSGATRFNGLLLGGVLLAGHLLARAPAAGQSRGQWLWQRRADLGLAGLAAAGALLILEPFLLFNPELLSQVSTTDDFAYSLQVARGQLLRPWVLADMHTVPYLHYWTHLWPLGVGWPLTAVFGLALFHALWRRHPPGLLALAWVALSFLLVGGLHTKHVRYLLPLLPFCCVLAADLCLSLGRRFPARRRLVRALTAAVVGYTAFYGLAFARIYLVEDSRLQAGRWLARHAPAGRTIAVERGGFSLHALIDEQRHPLQFLDEGSIFGTHGYLSCEGVRRHLSTRLEGADYLAITDVNRYQQYLAAPELYPAMAEFYRRLVAGELGFELAQRFKVYPALLGIEFKDDGAEPSFVGYDHPAVWIFVRRSDAQADWKRWEEDLRADPRCPDQPVREIAAALRSGNEALALEQLRALRLSRPEARYPALIEAYLHHRQGRAELEREALQRYLWGYGDLAHAAHLIPWTTATSLAEAGLDDLALQALADGAQRRNSFKPVYLPFMADTYIEVAEDFYQQGKVEYAAHALGLSAQIQPRPAACNALASLAYNAQRYGEATGWWEQSLQADSTQVEVHKNLVRAARALQDYPRAARHLERALQLDQTLTPQQRAEDYRALEEMKRWVEKEGR